VIATSGSAPAHWLPAAIEACEDDQPLLLLSADRPPELLECGANQATTQDRLFAAHAAACSRCRPTPAKRTRAISGVAPRPPCLWPRRGPVHVNVAFREPLVAARPERAAERWTPGRPAAPAPRGSRPTWPPSRPPPRGSADGAARSWRVALPPGDPAIAAVAGLARALDCPVIADRLSGLRAGDNGKARILCAADAFLRDPARRCPTG
jgi:2-succinyl-5-enolpyruvyl-6-hydroxy-3-cyclohexene-1-carboxylate synthase